MKKFKTKRKCKKFKIILLLIIVYFSYSLTRNTLNNNADINPEKYIKYLVNTGFNNQLNKKNNDIHVNNPISLIEYNLSFKSSPKVVEKQTVEYINKVNNNMDDPLIYIYNTHDTEEYRINYKYEYSIVPNIKLASYVLQEKLENLGIKSIVETNSVKEILNNNNWIYRDSYKASRLLVEKAKENNPSINYFIDVHRDSLSYDKTTIEKDNIKYAKVLFVVGLEHANYQSNLDLAIRINNIIEEKLRGISRGVSKKEGFGVNGIYNQDISPNSILIEIGGMENNIEEVANTINILGESLYSYIKEV